MPGNKLKVKRKKSKLIGSSIIFTICVLGLKPKFALASEELYFVHSDHLGSTSLVTNSQGQVVSQQSYYPYGSTRGELTANGQEPTDRLYTSQISDQDQTGLYYYNARYYNPQTALFAQADGFLSTPDKYSYVSGNPLVRVDASGATCRGRGCPFPEVSTLKEPVDAARARSELMEKYQVFVHPNAAEQNSLVPYQPMTQWPESLTDFYSMDREIRWYFSPKQLAVMDESLSRISPDIYREKWILPTVFEGGWADTFGVGVDVIGTQSASDLASFQSVFYHELIHVWELNDEAGFNEIIGLAKEAGFYERKERIRHEGKLSRWVRGITSSFNRGRELMGSTSTVDSYAAYDWIEFFAVIASQIAMDPDYASEFREFAPDLYAYMVQNFFEYDDPEDSSSPSSKYVAY